MHGCLNAPLHTMCNLAAAGWEHVSESSLVAPLLQRVAADVSDFVKSSGYNRMPTRSEMHSEGDLCDCMQSFPVQQHRPSPDARCMLPLPLLCPQLCSEL